MAVDFSRLQLGHWLDRVRDGESDGFLRLMRDPEYQLSMEDRDLLARWIVDGHGAGRRKEGFHTRRKRALTTDVKVVARLAEQHRDHLRSIHGRRQFLPGTRTKITDHAIALAMAEFEQKHGSKPHNCGVEQVRDLLNRPRSRRL